MTENPSIYRLSVDVRSSVKSAVLYGKQGEIVTILADHNEVLIVQSESGRFPVHRSLVTSEAVPDRVEPKLVEQQPTRKKPSTVKPNQSPKTLF